MKYFNGEIYEGEFYRNQRHGEGKLILANKSSYTGTWFAD
jgi:hypothetical protein